eukprot:m.184314 g.184314  ORF g.184314 m.184314 type:complete len:65 (+) comp39318_c4_seq22:4468-4662(+)
MLDFFNGSRFFMLHPIMTGRIFNANVLQIEGSCCSFLFRCMVGKNDRCKHLDISGEKTCREKGS